MKAAQYKQYGGPEVIEIVNAQEPEAKDNQVLVAVKAAAINPWDWKLRSGMFKDGIPLNFPVTIADDFSGVVVEDAGEYKKGDEIYGSASTLGGASGAAAERLTANRASTAIKPKNVNYQEGAALVLVGVSALQALGQLGLNGGKRILIHGGAGGIGSTAIQYAKHLGAYVATTARADDAEFVKGLGADQVIDYENEKFEEVVSDFDAVFDTIGGDTYNRSISVLRPGGIIISMNERPKEDIAKEHDIKALYQSTNVDTKSLDKLRELVEQGAIKPQVDKVFPLEQTVEAFKHLETGHPQGKVVITP
jgi:NADPH:quinone reductase-like Zn-dependent oxidoreductase